MKIYRKAFFFAEQAGNSKEAMHDLHIALIQTDNKIFSSHRNTGMKFWILDRIVASWHWSYMGNTNNYYSNDCHPIHKPCVNSVLDVLIYTIMIILKSHGTFYLDFYFLMLSIKDSWRGFCDKQSINDRVKASLFIKKRLLTQQVILDYRQAWQIAFLTCKI